MDRADMPEERPKRVALTKAQLGEQPGSQLASLCQRIAGDGRLSDVEIGELKLWLDQNESAQVPAVQFLRQAIAEVLEDGVVSDVERTELQRAVERVLPGEMRSDAEEARKEVARAEKLQKGRIVTFHSKVRGVTFLNNDGSSRLEIIETLRPGDALWLVREHDVPGHPNAIKILTDHGKQIGHISTLISSAEAEEGLASRMDRGIRVECRVKRLTGGGPKTRGVNIEIAYWKGYAEGQPPGPLLPPFVPEPERSDVDVALPATRSGCLSIWALILFSGAAIVGLFGCI